MRRLDQIEAAKGFGGDPAGREQTAICTGREKRP